VAYIELLGCISVKDTLIGRISEAAIDRDILSIDAEFYSLVSSRLSNMSYVTYSHQSRFKPLMSVRSMRVGRVEYARVSTLEQNADLQHAALTVIGRSSTSFFITCGLMMR
jgi:hypothetical protein